MPRFAEACLLVALSSSLFAQSPAFDVATIRPAVAASGGARASSSRDRVTLNNTTLLNALVRAFGLTSASQVAGPSWVFDNRYDIAAKAPANTPQEQIPLMLQALLIERFKLVLHHETRALPAYALGIGSGRLKLIQDEGNPKNSAVVTNNIREMKSTTMAALAQLAALTLRVPVVDETGLTGSYDFSYEVSKEENLQEAAPSLFTVIAELGLKLESHKQPFDVIVIDSGDKAPIPD